MERHNRTARLASALAATFALGCTGTIGLPGGSDDDGRVSSGASGGPNGGFPGGGASGAGLGGEGSDPGGSTGAGGTPGVEAPLRPGEVGRPPACTATGTVQSGRSIVRRLTQAEYDATILDLLGDDSGLARGFVSDGKVGLFENNAYSEMTSLLVNQYAEAAETLAASAMQERRDRILPCAPSPETETECARSFITTFGKRAYRRPLTLDEATRLEGLYTTLRAGGEHDFDGAVRVLLTAMLQSPNFLHHVEKGEVAAPGATVVRLTSHELASRLSYMLWGTMPDPELFAAADEGRLADDAGLVTEFERLVGHERTRTGVLGFYRQWLGVSRVADLTKSTEMFPEWNESLRTAAQAETDRFVDHVVWEGDSRLHTLLTARFSFVDEGLARLYGVPGVTGTDLVRVDLPPERSGLLSHVSILAGNAHSEQTSPVHRGKFVRERLFCHDLPSPPPTVDVTPPRADPSLTTRQRYAEHSSNEYCATCHKLMDPIGLGFESFDAIGKYRTTENGIAIDASGNIIETLDADGAFNGLVDLTGRLAESAEVERCVAGNWFGYAVGRGAGFPEDACSVDTIAREFSDSGGNLRTILSAVVRSDGFRHRPVIQPETCQ